MIDPVPAPDVPSPCVAKCRLADDRLHCPECLRTLVEIRQWRTMTPEQKAGVIRRINTVAAAIKD